jgi:hypothetical protein
MNEHEQVKEALRRYAAYYGQPAADILRREAVGTAAKDDRYIQSLAGKLALEVPKMGLGMALETLAAVGQLVHVGDDGDDLASS